MLKNCKTAIILAGGMSKRMGFDKIEIPFDNGKLLDYQVKTLKKVFKEIIIVSNTFDYYPDKRVKVVSDEFKHIGPLAGLHVGLKRAKSRFSYVIACDMPFINLEYIEVMDRLLDKNKHEILLTQKDGQLEPFHAMYHKSLYQKIEQYISRNERFSLKGFIEQTNYELMNPKIVHLFDTLLFSNLNTVEDIKKYLQVEVNVNG